jgi:acrylyl-CoA reductase (NADPH)
MPICQTNISSIYKPSLVGGIQMVASTLFRAIVARQDEETKRVAVGMESFDEDHLPEGDVTVDVEYSSLNYKDGLALLNKNRVIRSFPMIPGIDFAGTVAKSKSSDFNPGDAVILTGWGVGEGWAGGFAERARVKGEWLVKRPKDLDARSAMVFGTAGLTAMLSVMALERAGLKSGDNAVVTGAAGGVGSIAIWLLANRGIWVSALTGRRSEEAYLRALGATEVVDRASFADAGKPLQSERWKAAIDTVGSVTLSNVLASLKYGGFAAACGLAAGLDLPTTVAPFILRGISLLGIDSVYCDNRARLRAWQMLTDESTHHGLPGVARDVSLDDVLGLAPDIIDGRIRGRTVVRVRNVPSSGGE